MMRILDRGTSSVQDMVAIVLFNILPQIADIIIACTYIAAALEVSLYHMNARCCQHVFLQCND
jgi:ABC-type transport system involved in Fe-S cluster assembly fused permease/ATPase subunit